MTGVRETFFDRLVIFLGLTLRIAFVVISTFVAVPITLYLVFTTVRCWYVSSPLFEGTYALIVIWLSIFPVLAMLALSMKETKGKKICAIRWGEFGLLLLPMITVAILWKLFW